jgi:hypothetical protein
MSALDVTSTRPLSALFAVFGSGWSALTWPRTVYEPAADASSLSSLTPPVLGGREPLAYVHVSPAPVAVHVPSTGLNPVGNSNVTWMPVAVDGPVLATLTGRKIGAPTYPCAVAGRSIETSLDSVTSTCAASTLFAVFGSA